jgi:transcriptional regulator with XRE-family HTH domain
MSRFLLEPCKRFVEEVFWGQEVNFTEVKGRKIEDAVERVLEMLGIRIRTKVERVILLYGLEDGKRRTQEEVAKKFGVTASAIRQTRRKVFERLRFRVVAFYLRPFVCETIEEAEKALNKIAELEELERKMTEEDKNNEALRALFRDGEIFRRIQRMGITLTDITHLSEKELLKKLGMRSKSSKTEQALLKVRQGLLAKQRAS